MRIVCLLFAVGISVFSQAKPPSRIRFIENRNQWSYGTDFVARIPGGSMHVRGGTFSYVLIDERKIDEIHHTTHTASGKEEVRDHGMVDGVRVNVRFDGADPLVRGTGFGRSEEYYNYFIGNDESRWASGVRAYDGLYFKSLYPGVDLKLYTARQNLKYDLVVAPGSDPSVVRIIYEGHDDATLSSSNDLEVRTRLGNITEKKPVAYQLIDGKKRYVSCLFSYVDGVLSFRFPEGYDTCEELVIDPLLIFSTYSGSTADNWGSTATPGEHGTLYSSGITNHFSGGVANGKFPATPGAFQTNYGGVYDVAILKYDSVGSQLLYASYLGGEGEESSHSLVVNAQDELLVLGSTGSDDFPTSNTAYDRTFNGGTPTSTVFGHPNGTDIFVARISADGKTLLSSTYLGGTSNDGINSVASLLRKNYGDDLRGDIISDDNGNIFVSTVTESVDIQAVNMNAGGHSDAIVFRLPADLSNVTWARYIGGTGTDAAHSIKIGKNDNLYLAGGTTSDDFPVTGNAYQAQFGGDVDGWVAEISMDGQVIHNATYTGTTEYDQAYFVEVNLAGDIYLYGQTNGSRPVDPPDIYHNPNSGQFLQKFNSDLSQQLFYTVFGAGRGHPDISPTAFLVNDCNNLYMAGWGGSLNQDWLPAYGFDLSTATLPVTDDAYQKTSEGHDFYMLVLSPDARERLYATFLGKTSRTHVDGGTSRFDKKGIVYHAVCAGCGSGADDFPTTPGVVSRTNNSTNCNNAAFKFDLSSLKARVQVNGSNYVCMPQKAVLENISIGGERYFWNFGDGTPVLEQTELKVVEHEYKAPGTYTVWLKAFDPGTCRTSDSVSVNVVVGIATAEFPDDAEICEGTSHTFNASGGAAYQWTSKDGAYSSTAPSITVAPKVSTWLYINVLEFVGCTTMDSVFLRVVPKLNPEFSWERQADCLGENKLMMKNLTDSLMDGDRLYFEFGDGTTSDLEDVEHVYEKSGEYDVKLVGVREFCVTEKHLPLVFGPLKLPNVITPGVKDNINDTFRVQYGDTPEHVPADFGFRTQVQIYDRWGRRVFESDDYQHDWAAADQVTGVYYYEVTVEEHATCKGWIHVVK